MQAATTSDTSAMSTSGQHSVSRLLCKKPSASRSCAARSAVRQRPAGQRCRPHSVSPWRMSRAMVPLACGVPSGSGAGACTLPGSIAEAAATAPAADTPGLSASVPLSPHLDQYS